MRRLRCACPSASAGAGVGNAFVCLHPLPESWIYFAAIALGEFHVIVLFAAVPIAHRKLAFQNAAESRRRRCGWSMSGREAMAAGTRRLDHSGFHGVVDYQTREIRIV